MGTTLSDAGPSSGPSAERNWWLLTVSTLEGTQLSYKQKCTTVKAKVIPSAKPPADPEMLSVTRFEKADNRVFEVAEPEDPDMPTPDLPP